MSEEQGVAIWRDGGIARLEIRTGHKLNTFTESGWIDLLRALDELEQKADLAVLVLHGSEETGFSAGANLQDLARRSEERRFHLVNSATRAVARLAAFPLPTIAAISGVAVGGGMELALACDFRIATPDARLGLPELRLGLLPGLGGTQRLGRLVGQGLARYLIFGGSIVSGNEAARMGLVEVLCGDEGSLASAVDIARRIGAHGPEVLRMAKALFLQSSDGPLQAGLMMERLAQGMLMGKPEQVRQAQRLAGLD